MDRTSSLTKKHEEKFVDIFIQCKNLPKFDMFSKTDPFCVLFVKRYGEWCEMGRTEIISNCYNPKFAEYLLFDVNKFGNTATKLSVYNSINANMKDLNKAQHIASVTVKIEETEKFREHILLEDNKQNATLLLYVRPHVVNKRNIILNLGALKLSRRGLFTRPDPFFQIETELYPGTFHPIYRSETVYKNANPRWHRVNIDIYTAFMNSKEQEICINVFNSNAKGDHELLGRVKLSLKFLLANKGIIKQIALTKPNQGRKIRNADSITGASLVIYFIGLHNFYSLNDYIAGGLRMNATIFIDFTYSNGHPSDPTSLHALNAANSNEYIEVLYNIISWLIHYCHMISLMGFGGEKRCEKIKDSNWLEMERQIIENLMDHNTNESTFNEDDYCFNINTKNSPIDSKDTNVNRNDALIQSYRNCLPYIYAQGPTFFAPIIRRALKNINKRQKEEFSFVFILTDGICSDVEDFKEIIMNNLDEMVILIIIGVGPCNFRTMKYHVDAINKFTDRKIVYFADLSNYYITQTDLKEFYVDLARGILKILENTQITPVASTKVVNDGDSPTSYAKQNNNNNNNTCCPTCGSFVMLD